MEIDYKRLEKFYSTILISTFTGMTNLTYSAYVTDKFGNTISRILEYGSHICYGALLNTLMQEVVNLSEEHLFRVNIVVKNNCIGRNKIFTWMNAEELNQPVKYLVDAFSPEFLGVSSCGVKTQQDGELNIEIFFDNTISKIKLKLFLFWIRNAIKWPHNLFLADAIQLQNQYYPNDELYNLLKVVVFGTAIRQNEYSNHWSENWSSWGPFVSVEEIKQQIESKDLYNINGIEDRGLFPDNYYEKDRITFLKEEVDFRSKNKTKLAFVRAEDSSSFSPKLFLKNEKRFDLYREIYDFKHTLKPLYM